MTLFDQCFVVVGPCNTKFSLRLVFCRPVRFMSLFWSVKLRQSQVGLTPIVIYTALYLFLFSEYCSTLLSLHLMSQVSVTVVISSTLESHVMSI